MQIIHEHLLDAAQEIDLARRVEAGVYARHLLDLGRTRPGLARVAADGEQAWQRLWLANVGMVKVLANRYGRRDPELVDDLIQEGWVALATALMRFDCTRGVRLSTQAWHWVKHHLVHVMQERSAWETATGPEVGDYLAETAVPEPVESARQLALGVLEPLSPLDRRILLARAHGARQSDVADELGVSLSSARRLEERATRHARESWLGRAS